MQNINEANLTPVDPETLLPGQRVIKVGDTYLVAGVTSVTRVNGKTGNVQITADDLGVYTKSEVDAANNEVNETLESLFSAMDSLLGLNVTTLIVYVFEQQDCYFNADNGDGYAYMQNVDTGETIEGEFDLGKFMFPNVSAGLYYLVVSGNYTRQIFGGGTSNSSMVDGVLMVYGLSRYLTELSFEDCTNLSTLNGITLPTAIENGNKMFSNCTNLELSLKELTADAPGGGYEILSANRMFKGCQKVTGSRSEFLAKCPKLTSEQMTEMFSHSSAVSDIYAGEGDVFVGEISVDYQSPTTVEMRANQDLSEKVIVKNDHGTVIDSTLTLGKDSSGNDIYNLTIPKQALQPGYENDTSFPLYVIIKRPGEEVKLNLGKSKFTSAHKLSVGMHVEFDDTNGNSVLQRVLSDFRLPDGLADTISMFRGCHNLTFVHKDFVIPGSVSQAEYMFFGCDNLTSVPLGIIGANLTSSDFMFKNCTNLQLSIDDLAAAAPPGGYSLISAREMFYNCPNVTGSRSAFLSVCPNLQHKDNMFVGTSTTA